MKAIMIALVVLAVFSPVATAKPLSDDDPCICPPDNCGPAPNAVEDPMGRVGWQLCKVLGGHPW